ncbi:BlaI/MecI/CopY family transcriptional regulator [Actinocorallia sp. API 0066]|uniref:BlaI/MecI/CopY family transcriptional regulator n=1 Tax=Actinocorallia sp. API 0066 TaxID=2896846 RepID=UPI001E52C72E|nr:BlaI/MecI/CopY family transcriptional regulator [Actinocorallia sp. API 0066]MCD0453493.1 BlaI/MecI/CopY family transcriptional regulator [Actinocorallia sp. API 0066]
MPPKDPSDSASPIRRRRSGQLEAHIITVLVDTDRAMTPGEVLDALGATSNLSYSSVVTTLTRLHQKGAVVRRRHGRAFRYRAIADAPSLTAERMSKLLTDEADRTSVLRRFIGSLDSQDEQTLRRLLQEAED